MTVKAVSLAVGWFYLRTCSKWTRRETRGV